MSRFLIELNGERQNVTSLEGYEEWSLVSAVDATIPDPAAELRSGKWVVPIEVLRERKWPCIKAARDTVMHGGCDTPLGRMDTDAESQAKITGAATMAQLAGPGFEISWTMADNSVVVHDHTAMVAAALAVGQFVADCHAAGQRCREAIETADEAGLDAIVFSL